jgi:transposase-like protein
MVYKYELNMKNEFKRLFLCPGVLTMVINYCKPIVIVDACHLRLQYGGVVMSACVNDGENQIVPIAVAIVDIENQDNWEFFFIYLLKAIPILNNENFTIIHDREKGLSNAQNKILPLSNESICLFHLEKNINSRFKTKLNGRLWTIAKSTTIRNYNKIMDDIKKDHINIYNYL